jgi:mannose-6-phosphate isomerase-like protein (cupin superfamily)
MVSGLRDRPRGWQCPQCPKRVAPAAAVWYGPVSYEFADRCPTACRTGDWFSSRCFRDRGVARWRWAALASALDRALALHHSDDEAWYVLEGRLQVKVGNDVFEARAGSSVFVPRGTPHTYWNPRIEPCRYLLIMTSKIYRMIHEIHATTDRTPAALGALFRKYDSELLGG